MEEYIYLEGQKMSVEDAKFLLAQSQAIQHYIVAELEKGGYL